MSNIATPKSAGRRQAALASQSAPATPTGLLDAFPVWQDQAAEKEKEAPVKFEDPLGTALPSASQPFCDAWKRSEELLHGAPNVPLVCLKPVADAEKKGKGAATSRELEGKLYAGHETFDSLLGVITYIMSAEKYIKRGEYLWELIHPKDKDGLPARSLTGKYRVKMFILDTWRTVTIDDRIPVDLFGRALLVGSRPLQLWPLLLCKAVLKVMAVFRSLEMTLPHQVAAFQMLAGWPQEDLLDSLGGTPLAGGKLFDRLEEVLGGPCRQVQDLPAIASCCLVKRSKPKRAPPRLVVLTGPSGVGRSHLIAKLVAELPDKFGITVSHTTRPPREHEVDGKDYNFTDKSKLLADVRGKNFLEAARVKVHTRPCTSSEAAAALAPPKGCSYWYGTSLSTVREVAATGKLCLMSLDMQGAEALHSNKRIDGLYLYVNTSSPEILASRQKQRLSEDASTIAKRVAWAKQQVAKSATPGLFDAVIANTSISQVYASLKEAISTLSPIIRNRLRGLPAYVLDYSDLIPPNSVEKPFLKPVILAGPNTGERRKLLEMLVAEFPDVFAWPRQHTTCPSDEHASHVGVDGDELHLVTDKPGATPRFGVSSDRGDILSVVGTGPAGMDELTRPAQQNGSCGTGEGSISNGAGSDNNADQSHMLGPPPVVLGKEDFETAAANGKFLESHSDLFKHKLVTHKHGYSMEHVREVIKSGKLPLLELEAEGAEAVKLAKSIDCLTIFLAPPSIEIHEQRLKDWVTETAQEIAERQALAAAELEAVRSTRVFDQIIINDDLEQGYKQLKAAIGRFRPDLIAPADDNDAAQAGKKAAASNQPVPLVVQGPTGGGREQLIQQLLQRYPHRFVIPRKLTDRKPAKGEKDTPDLEFVKPEALAKFTAQGQIVYSQQDPASGGSVAITADSLHDLAAAGKMAVLDAGTYNAEQLQLLLQHPAAKGAFAVYVCRKAALSASLAASGIAEAAANVQIEKATAQLNEIASCGLYQAVVTNDDAEEAFAQLQEPLCVASPWAMPPLLMPLVVAAPFGSGKRAVLQKLVKMLPNVFAVPKVVTSKPRAVGYKDDMEVISSELASQMHQEGKFLVEQQVLGHVYGITAAAVRKLQASGKLPVLDLDRVADVAKLKAAGFQATYIYLQPPSLEQLQQRIRADVLANPPLHHEPADAAAAAAAEAVREASAAAAQPELFDQVLLHDPQELQTTLGKLAEAVQQRYSAIVPTSFVWGYGRPLWDPAARKNGLRPLKVMLLGPAASGKSTQCEMLSARFKIPHIHAGDLLYAEVAAKTVLGLEAKKYMDNSKTVPDHYLLSVLLKRLAAADCQTRGWVIDGFPHTQKQAQVLADAGHVPDKVVLLAGPRNLLLDRVRYRRIDYSTGKVYHLAETGALSETVRPVKPDGSLDTEVMARLVVRHDDSTENVANRLALWDRQVQGLQAAYEDLLLHLPAAGKPDDVYARVEAFIKLEASIVDGRSPCSIYPRMASYQLEELMYRLVATLRYQRKQLVQLQQLDGKLVWCDLKELASNSSCLLLGHNPAMLPIVKSIKRLDSNSIPRQHLLAVECSEPCRLLACLSMGPQHLALPPAPVGKKVFMLAGSTGAGRSTLAGQLLHDFEGKLSPVALLTNRKPHMLEVGSSIDDQQQQGSSIPAAESVRCHSSCAGVSEKPTPRCYASVASVASSSGAASTVLPGRYRGSELLQFVPEQQFQVLKRSGQLAGLHQHLGHSYGVAAAAVEAAAAEGKVALVVGSLLLAEQLRKELQDTQVVCVYVNADTASLDYRMRLFGHLEEERLQQLLQDALQQQQLLHQLLEQQEEAVRDELLYQAMAAAAASNSAAQQPAASGTASSGTAVVARLQLNSALTPSAKLTQQQAAALAAQQQALQQQQQQQQQAPSIWLHAVCNFAGQLQVCYSEVNAALAKQWPVQQQRLPGLLLLQRHVASSVVPAASNTGSLTSRSSNCSHTLGAAADVVTAASSACLDEDVYSQSQTVLRLKSNTAAGSVLQLPRGKHLLQLQCSPLLLHCISFYAAADFTVEEASKLVPATYGLHVTTHDGQTEALQPGSKHLVFRYMLKPSEPCIASFELRTSSSALQSCSQLLLVCNDSRRIVSHVLNQPTQVQLEPTGKGYVLLCLAEPHMDVPAGGWSISITSSRPLLPLQDQGAVRQAAFEGTYAVNAKAMVTSYVISPAVPVQLALLSLIKLPGSSDNSAHSTAATAAVRNKPIGSATSAVLTNSGSSSSCNGLAPSPLAYTLQLLDTGGAKETVWGASYKLLAEASGGPDGRALIPSVLLQPGKYQVVLQLQPQDCRKRVDPVSGDTDPLPNWHLLLLPSADEKVCPIAKDDAYERHFKLTTESWQQQALLNNTALTAGRPGSGARVSSAAMAKDRPKQAQAALDRHLAAAAAEQASSLATGSSASQGMLAALSVPGSTGAASCDTAAPSAAPPSTHGGTSSGVGARKTSQAGRHRPAHGGDAGGAHASSHSGSTSSTVQATPRLASSFGTSGASLGYVQPKPPGSVVVRQLKTGDAITLAPTEHLKRVTAGTAGGAVKQPDGVMSLSSSGSQQQEQRQQKAVLISQAQLAERVQQLQLAAERDAEQLKCVQQQSGIGALQAQQAAEFVDWRGKRLAEVQAVAARKQKMLTALTARSALDMEAAAALIAATPAQAILAHRQQDKAASKGR